MKNINNPKESIKKPRIIESVNVASPIVSEVMNQDLAIEDTESITNPNDNIDIAYNEREVEQERAEKQEIPTKNKKTFNLIELRDKALVFIKKIDFKNPKTLIFIALIIFVLFLLIKILPSIISNANLANRGNENKIKSETDIEIVHGARPKTTIKTPEIPTFSKKTYQASVDGITWYYSLDEKGNCLLRYTFSELEEDLSIPTYVDNHPVIAIGQPNSTSGIFQTTMGLEDKNSDTIKSLTIPYGVEYIFDSALSSLTNLESVTLPETITYLGNRVFAFNTNLKYLNSDKEGRVNLPSSLEYYGNSLFRNCESIEEFNFPEHINYIQMYTFYGCTSIKGELTIPSQYKLILEGAFSNVPNYETLIIESGTTFIGDKAFENNTSLKRVLLPTSVTGIGNHAFSNDKDIKEFLYTGKLSYLGKNPFSETDINIDDFIKPSQIVGFEN